MFSVVVQKCSETMKSNRTKTIRSSGGLQFGFVNNLDLTTKRAICKKWLTQTKQKKMRVPHACNSICARMQEALVRVHTPNHSNMGIMTHKVSVSTNGMSPFCKQNARKTTTNLSCKDNIHSSRPTSSNNITHPQ